MKKKSGKMARRCNDVRASYGGAVMAAAASTLRLKPLSLVTHADGQRRRRVSSNVQRLSGDYQ